MWTNEALKAFGSLIQKLIDRQDLTRDESYDMFSQVLCNLQPDLQQGAFLAALSAKGETPQEIAGAWQAIVELDTTAVTGDLGVPLVENSGTGMDRLKTFNVSSAAAVVAAAGGARLARHGARALSSSCGTVDLLEAVGVDVECEVATVAKSIREIGIGIFNGMSPKVHPRSLARILSQIRFGSTLNLAASLASPCRPTHALRGVYAESVIPKAAAVMQEIGYERAMVVHGYDTDRTAGMDELSTIGESQVCELYPDGRQMSFVLAPEDVGIQRADYGEVAATGNVRREAVRFLKVIAGTDHPACIDLTCLNAGAILYLVNAAADIRSGIDTSREMIHSGSALEKLAAWVSTQADVERNGIDRFASLAEEAGVAHRLDACLS